MRHIIAVALAFAFAALCWSPAGAQTVAQITDSNARVDFPNGFAFEMTFEAPAAVDEVRLIYEVAPDGVSATAVPRCTAGTVSTCQYDLGISTGTRLIPGAEVTYFWRITSGGASVESEPETIAYEDTRFDWQTVADGNLAVWYYNGDEEEAQGILEAGRSTLDNLGTLLRTTVDYPVKIFYYDTASEMQPAIISDAGPGVITRGEVVYSDTAMVSADTAAGDIARHEIAHIVVRARLGGLYSVPDWLNEGTAVYAQTQPLGDQQDALDSAIRSGNVLSVRSMSSASSGATSSTVSLFYGQSYSVVNYLIEEYGEEKFGDLFAAFAEGDTTAGALEAVYGFDQDGLENEWRASVGLPPRSVPTPVNAADEDATEEPATDNSSTGPDGGGNSGLVIFLVVAISAVVAGGILLAGVTIVRRRG